MTVYRKARPDEMAKCTAFANMVFFTGDDPRRFETLLPKVYGPNADPVCSAGLHNIAVRENGEIVGLVAALPGKLHVGDTVLSTAYVGTVSVHPQARGEGHMKELMRITLQEAMERGADIAFLGGQRQRYEYFGFSPAGEAYMITYDIANVRHALREADVGSIAFRRLTDETDAALAEIEALRQTDTVWFERPRSRLLACMQSYLQDVYAVEQDGRFAGWVVYNPHEARINELRCVKADDEERVIKAWLLQNGQKSVHILTPPWAAARLRRAGLHAEHISRQTDVNVRILRPERVLPALMRLRNTYAPLTDGELRLNAWGQGLSIRVEDGNVSAEPCAVDALPQLTPLALTRLCAYPFDYEGRPQTPAGWFPLPVFAPPSDGF